MLDRQYRICHRICFDQDKTAHKSPTTFGCLRLNRKLGFLFCFGSHFWRFCQTRTEGLIINELKVPLFEFLCIIVVVIETWMLVYFCCANTHTVG